MLEIGARSNDLPERFLLLLADHYQRANSLWTRLKGLLFYPLLVVIVSLGLTLILSIVFTHFLTLFSDQFGQSSPLLLLTLWAPPITLGIMTGLGLVILSRPSWRAKLRWRLPAFREASLAQLASALALMLKNGAPLPQALSLAEALDENTAASRTLSQWREQV